MTLGGERLDVDVPFHKLKIGKWASIRMERRVGSTVTSGFPIDDAHGNTDATIARNGTGGYTVNDRRSYDARSNLRYSQATGDPKQRYCASLGYRADDETLLTYLWSRYYDPTSGRFVSEDPSKHGGNWFASCSNNLTNKIDHAGRFDVGRPYQASSLRF